MSKEKVVVGFDENGNEVKVLVKKPTQDDYRKGSILYAKAFRDALEGGSFLRDKLNEHLVKEGLWSKEKQEASEELSIKIAEKEKELKKGGVSLKAARIIALEIKTLRELLKELISVRINFDNNTAEGLADNARFDYMISVNIFDPVTGQKKFRTVEEYNAVATQPWAVKAATEIASMFYELETAIEDSFLAKFNMVDSDGRLVNKNGHLISVDIDGVERLIDKDGNYVAYDENNNQYRVDRDGKKVDEIETLPFTDDDGNEYDKDGNILEKKEEPVEEKKTRKKKADDA
jgi:hypothetical protein